MGETTTQSDIVALVASLAGRLGFVTEARRGPVPLARCLDEFNLLHVTLPRLRRADIGEYLLGEGITPGNVMDAGNAEDLFAGFLFTTGPDGLVFVGATEADASEKGQPPKFRPSPLGRRRFTVAHELGHFLLHRERMIAGRWLGDTKETIREAGEESIATMEREANQFAVELLMPENLCRQRAEEFKKRYKLKVCPRQPFAYHLASELLVSSEAMRYRLKNLGIGDE